MTNDAKYAEYVNQFRCVCQCQHDHVIGGKSVTTPMAYYPRQMNMKLAAYLQPKKTNDNDKLECCALARRLHHARKEIGTLQTI